MNLNEFRYIKNSLDEFRMISNQSLESNRLLVAVENMAYKKESWINNKRHFKRHTRNRWMHGHASRAVDGDFDQSLHSCTILDNFYVERPIWMVDLGRKTRISGVIVVTWQGRGQGTAEAIEVSMADKSDN